MTKRLKRWIRFSLPLTPDQYERAKKAAWLRHIPMTEYLRRMIDENTGKDLEKAQNSKTREDGKRETPSET